MINKNIRKKAMEEQLDDLRERIIKKHKPCKGTGFLNTFSRRQSKGVLTFVNRAVTACKCRTRFKYISIFIYSNVPYESLLNQKIYGRVVVDAITGDKIEIRKEIINPYVKHIVKAIKTPYGFLFLGKNGVGKTFLGLKLLYYAVMNGFTVHNIDFADYLKLARKSFSFDSSVEAMLDEIMKVDLLVIDEIGNESKRSEFAISELKSLYKKRVSLRRPTILITNYSWKSFKKIYKKSIENMVRSHSRVFDFSLAADVRTTKCGKDMASFFKEIARD